MSRSSGLAVLALVFFMSAAAHAKPPGKKAAKKVATAFVAAVVAFETAASNDDDPASEARQASLAKLGKLIVKHGFTFETGYEAGGSDDGTGCEDDCTCGGSIGDAGMIGWAMDCIEKNQIGADGDWFAWSKQDMKDWSWQIDDSAIPGLAKNARLFALHIPEGLVVIAVVTDADGVVRVSAVYDGITYD